MAVSDEDFLLQLDGLVEGVTPLTQAQDNATPDVEHQPEGEKLLADDLALGLDQDLELQQQEQQQQQEQHQQQEQQQEQQNQQDYYINHDVE